MQSGTYIIFLGTGSGSNQYCLGTEVSDQRRHCVVARYDANSSKNTWILSTAPGTDDMEGFYLQHLDTQLFAHFGSDSGIYLDPLNPNSVEYFLRLDDVGDGQVAINNHSDDRVMDANGDDAGVGALVTPWKWNRGDNQRWRFVSTDVLTPGG